VSSLKIRLASVLILLPLALIAILLGSRPYTLMITLVTGLACFEYVQMLKRKGYHLSLFWVCAMDGLWLADALWGNGQWLGPGIAVIALAVAAWILYRRQKNPNERDPTAEWGMTLAGGVYIGVGGAYLLRMRALPDGLWWTITALPIIWVGESVAYAIGSKWGTHKMSPTISPGKSWEGYAGEVASSLIMGLCLGGLWPLVAHQPIALNMVKGIWLGGILSILSPAGDFFVSMIKREVNVKDTGALIPGHGGMFDRIDSLLWAGFITWTVATLFN